MKLDERLKELKHYPGNNNLQQDIRKKLDDKRTRKSWNMLGSRFGELSFMVLVILLGSFLVFISLNGTQQAASDSIKAIYSYESKETNQPFRAKPSTLYIGMENVTTNSMIALFENIDELPAIEPQSKHYGDYEIIVVYENGEQRRFEIDYDYLYDVDQNVYYSGYEQMSTVIYSELFNAHYENKLPLYILPLMIGLIQILANVYYSRRKIPARQKFKETYISMALCIIAFLGIYYYATNIGVLYLPSLFLCILVVANIMWWPTKLNETNVVVRRVEFIQIIAYVLLIMVFLIWG